MNTDKHRERIFNHRFYSKSPLTEGRRTQIDTDKYRRTTIEDTESIELNLNTKTLKPRNLRRFFLFRAFVVKGFFLGFYG